MLAAAFSATDGGTVTQRVTMAYDAMGNRIQRQAWDGTTTVTERIGVDAWDTSKPTPIGNENADAWIDLDGSNAVTARHVWGLNFDEVVARVSAAGTVTWYQADRQGSVRKVFDNSGSVLSTTTYTAYGSIASGSLGDRYGYTGQQHDLLTGFVSMGEGTREYDPFTGRFLAADPKGFAAGDENLYGYVGNGPTNGTDPSGMDDVPGFSAFLASSSSVFSNSMNFGTPLPAGTKVVVDSRRQPTPITPGSSTFGTSPLGSTPFGPTSGPPSSSSDLDLAIDPGRLAASLAAMPRDQNGRLLGGGIRLIPGTVAPYADRFEQRLRPDRLFHDPQDTDVEMYGKQLVVELGMLVIGPVMMVADLPTTLREAANFISDPSNSAIGQALKEDMNDDSAYGWARRTVFLGSLFYPALKWQPGRISRAEASLQAHELRVNTGLQYYGTCEAATRRAQSVLVGKLRLEVKPTRWSLPLLACFTAGTPLLTPNGSKPIEQLIPGDLVLSRHELDPAGEVEPKVVEEVFRRTAKIVAIRVGNQTIHTTSEHPFWVWGKGWLAARELMPGDTFASHDGQRVVVAEIMETEDYAPVYNLRISDFHTYFVGSDQWGFSVWAHNSGGVCAPKPVNANPGHSYPPNVRDLAPLDPFFGPDVQLANAQTTFRTMVANAKNTTHNFKHLKAKTEAQAQQFSSGGGDAQYLPTDILDGITHKGLEKLALEKGVYVVHKNGYYAFLEFDRPIGYNNGRPTRWIRAELSSGQYHGHPFNPDMLPSEVTGR